MTDFVQRLELVASESQNTDFAKMNEAANRIIRICKDYQTEQLPNKALFNNSSETQLMECTISIDETKLNYKELFTALSKAIPAIDEFFENVLVMDKDEKIKENRLALLYNIKKKFDKIADFSKFVV